MSSARIAVLVCSWAAGEHPAFDVSQLADLARSLPGVVTAQTVERICSEKGSRRASSILRESGADRFVVVACSPATKEATHRAIAEEAGLHPLAFEVADVREGAAYVHGPENAPRKARLLLEAAVARSRAWVPPPFDSLPLSHRRVAVVGDGLQGALVAEELLALGCEVTLIVSRGSMASPPSCLFRDERQRLEAATAMQELPGRQGAEVLLGCRVTAADGALGDLRLALEGVSGPRVLNCGAVVLAPDVDLELRDPDGRPAPSPTKLAAAGVRSLAILAGGRSSGTGCSCMTPRGTQYALQALREAPGTRVALLGREVRALGGTELPQAEAQRQGASFHRIDAEPEVQGRGPWTIDLQDPLVGHVRLQADLLLIDSVAPVQAGTLAKAFALPLDEKGELLSMDSRLRPGETVRQGIFACRQRVGNMLLEDIQQEAACCAARAAEAVLAGQMEVGGRVAQVDGERCSACLTCVRICPYSAPRIGPSGKAEVRLELCQGCGTCVPLCPSRALDLYRSSDAQMLAQLHALGRSGG